jgi:hypothetical protein
MFKVDYLEDYPSQSVVTTDIPYLKNPDFLCVIGSRLYGTENENSDLDIRGFVFMPKDYTLGIKKFEQHMPQNLSDGDFVVWSVEKFVNMLLKGSSVAFEMLFCPDTHVLRKSAVAKALMVNKAWFVSQRVIKASLGYAQSEWRKVKGETTRDLGARRKAEIEKYGYSVRNASHAIRILDSFYSLGKYGSMKFPCDGHAFLKAVKEGNVKFEDAEGIYEQSLERLEECLDLVPRKVPLEKINNLLVSLNLKLLLTSEIERIIEMPV